MTCTPHTQRTRTVLARRNARNAVVADEEDKAVWEGRQAGWGGGQGGVAGSVWWRARWGGGQDGMEGRVRWRAGSWGAGRGGGRAGGSEGMDLRSKEGSGVNIVT